MKKIIATLITSIIAFCPFSVALAVDQSDMVTTTPSDSVMVIDDDNSDFEPVVNSGEESYVVVENVIIEEDVDVDADADADIDTEEEIIDLEEEETEPALWPVVLVTISVIIGLALVIIFNLLG